MRRPQGETFGAFDADRESEREHDAAAKLQAAWQTHMGLRGSTRSIGTMHSCPQGKPFDADRESEWEHDAAVKLQAAWQTRVGQRRFRAIANAVDGFWREGLSWELSAIKIQQAFRRFEQRRWLTSIAATRQPSADCTVACLDTMPASCHASTWSTLSSALNSAPPRKLQIVESAGGPVLVKAPEQQTPPYKLQLVHPEHKKQTSSASSICIPAVLLLAIGIVLAGARAIGGSAGFHADLHAFMLTCFHADYALGAREKCEW
jgi:hypothetical protein